MTRLSTVVWPWMFSVLSCLLAGRNWVAHPSTATYSNQNNLLKCVCVCLCDSHAFLGSGLGTALYVGVYIYIYLFILYNSICMYCISLCVQAGSLFSPTCFTYSNSISYSQHDLETKDIDANIPKCFRDGTAMYSWDSKSPTWAAQVKLAFFCRATCQSLPIGTYFFWIGWCFF